MSDSPFNSGADISVPGAVLSSNDPSDGSTNPGQQTPLPSQQAAPPVTSPAPPVNAQPNPAQPIPAQKPPMPANNQRQTFTNPVPPAQPQSQIDNHAAVKQASLIHKIGETLAGAPQNVSIDQNGVRTSTPVTLTGKQIALSLALYALSGAAKGAAVAPGPGVEGRAAAAGFNAGEQAVQQRQQQQEELSREEYARKAQILETNLKLRNNALLIGKQDQAMNQQYVDSYKDVLKQVDDMGGIVAHHVSYSELPKYNATTHTAIPEEVVPRMGRDGQPAYDADGKPLYDINYAIVDPKLTGTGFLTDRDIAIGKKYGVPGFDNPNLPDSPMRYGFFASQKATVDALPLMDQEFQQFAETYNAHRPKDAAPLVIDLAAATRDNGALLKVLPEFQGYLIAAQGNITNALAAMHQQNPMADQIAGLFGGYGNTQLIDFINHKPTFNTAEQAISYRESQAKDSPQWKFADQAAKDLTQQKVREAALIDQEKQRFAAAAAGSEDVPTLGEALAKGELTEDQIPGFSKLKPQIQAYLAQHHPNLDQSSLQMTGEERKRRDLAQNAISNLNIIQGTLQQRPDLFGIIQGRVSQGKELAGTNDGDLTKINEALDNYALASTGAHGIRAVEARVSAKKALLNGFKNGPVGVNAAISTAKRSLQEFANLGKPRGIDGSLYVYKTGQTPQYQFTTKDGKMGWDGSKWVPIQR